MDSLEKIIIIIWANDGRRPIIISATRGNIKIKYVSNQLQMILKTKLNSGQI